jgi:hypothetical protein
MKGIFFALNAWIISGTKWIQMGLVLAVLIFIPRATSAARQAPIDLESAAHFTFPATFTSTPTIGGITYGDRNGK